MERKLPRITVTNLFAFILLLLTTFFIIFTVNKYNTPESEEQNIKYINYYGVYRVNDKLPDFTIPADRKLTLEQANKITLRLNFAEKINKNTQVNLYAEKSDIKVYSDDKELFSYDYDSQPEIVKNIVSNNWVSFTAPEINTYDTIYITLSCSNSELTEEYLTEFLENISVGSQNMLLKHQLNHYFTQILSAVLTLVIGFVLLVVLLSFKIMRSPIEIGSISCALLMISGAISSLINYNYISLVFNRLELICTLDYLNLLSLMLLLLFYVRIYIHKRTFHRAIDFFIYLWTIAFIGFFIYNIFDYREISLLTICLIRAAVVMLATLLLMLLTESKDSSVGFIPIFFTIGLIATMLAEAYARATKDEFISAAFHIAIIIFAVAHFISIMYKAQRSFVQAAKAEQMENELIQSKVSVMLGQIQPHFLYNTLVVIRQLCDINPKTAKEAVTEFATYLRGNLDSLTLNTTIPFEKEMDHIENYISLEKKRFGDKINVEYDFECLDFSVPALTVQTIVENAIRHGVTKKKEGGTVTIKTRESIYNYIVEVHDDGVGMDLTKPPEYNDNRSHIGLDNVRKRVETMCNGEVLFVSTPNIGTTVYMSLPKVEDKTEQNNK
ncbi:MAG: histidine kinase [Acutalibacteraceae bacterium]|nr:histidine kinase [Acutalibacteraceae bacterium]